MPFIAGRDAITQRLIDVLGLSPHTSDVTIRIPAGAIATLEVTRLLTTDELHDLTETFITEGITLAECETTYTLEPRGSAAPAATSATGNVSTNTKPHS